MAKYTRGWIRILALLTGLLFSFGSQAEDNGWTLYKQRFLLPDGRVVDTGNKNISHTEGQGYAMLLAVYNNDRQAFDSMWRWTNATLLRKDIGLFSWRYEPGKAIPIADKNNATDGDIFIAWALLEAGKKWNVREYLRSSSEIQRSLLRNTLVKYAGYNVLLPGVSGFKQSNSITLNPSYFAFPAWQAFYEQTHLLVWKNLSDDGLALINKMSFGKARIPTDWVTLFADGRMAPANGWPARFGFDAVRIPLYIHWYQDNNPALAPFIRFWQGFDRQAVPAWVDVMSGARAGYNQSPGMMAVRDLVLGAGGQLTNRLVSDQDYYSASLYLLTYWSVASQR